MPAPKVAIVIPARMDSRRLPGKPLLTESGKPMICHVIEKCRKRFGYGEVFLATPDQEIEDAIYQRGQTHPYEACVTVRTSSSHRNGTARVAEVARNLDVDIVVNCQGDLPEVSQDHLDALIERASADWVSGHAEEPVWTLVEYQAEPVDPSVVKVVVDPHHENCCLWFTRTREALTNAVHIGVYAYSMSLLKRIAALPRSSFAEFSGLEQIAWVQNGIPIHAVMVEGSMPSVDTREDYEAFVKRYREDHP